MTATSRPLISVIIPTYNEEAHIGAVLDDLLSQDYGHSRLETLVADGGSTGSTREIVQKKAEEYGGNLIKLIDNPGRYVPSGLNLAIGQSRGEVIVRMDAHSRYPKDYLSTLVRYLLELGADNVGGTCQARRPELDAERQAGGAGGTARHQIESEAGRVRGRISGERAADPSDRRIEGAGRRAAGSQEQDGQIRTRLRTLLFL
jgi:glycosyltransferase involved in cell wall biosynthesis